MEQMLESLQAEMRAKMKAHREEMNVLMDANLERMKAYLEVTETCLGKTEVMKGAGQNQLEAEIMTGLEEMKATVRSQSKEERGHCGEP
jgi:hypothetical protein